jgi:hypothetical protein
MSARETIENLWDRAIPVGPLLDAVEAEARTATPAGPAPAPDRDTLRERIRLAIARQFLAETGSGRTVEELDDAEFGDLADAVLAVLPAPTDQTAVRAAALREAADFVGNDDDCDCGGCDTCVPRQLAAELRRLAGEAQQDEARAEPVCGDSAHRHGGPCALYAREAQQDPTQDGEGGPDPDCERCDGSGLDPDRYTKQWDTDGNLRGYRHEPCSECLPEDAVARPGQPETEARP